MKHSFTIKSPLLACLVFKKIKFAYPIRININSTATIEIDKFLHINMPRTITSKNILGTFRMDCYSKLYAGNFFIRPGCDIHIGEHAVLSIGSGYINERCRINCNHMITIGKGVVIADDVIIRDNDAHSINKKKDHLPVTIEDHVWVGTRVIILKGVRIGTGSVIGAGSVVTKSVPPFSLAVGVPATVVKSNIFWK